MSFSHPLPLIANTCYHFYPLTNTILGTIDFLVQPQSKYIYLLADDSCQFNQVIKPKGIGVTAFLNVNFHQDIHKNKANMQVQIVKRQGKKSYIQGKIFDDDTIYATYDGLFVISPLIQNIKFQENSGKDFIIKREGGPSQKLCIKQLYEKTDKILWKDGYGPKNFVHGGVLSFPIFDEIPKPKSITINYRRPIPLLSESILNINENEFKLLDQEGIQVDGSWK